MLEKLVSENSKVPFCEITGINMSSKSPTESDLTKQYGKGFSMLKKMGFKTGAGLGPSGEGIVNPIQVKMRRLGEGLRDDEGEPETRKPMNRKPKPHFKSNRKDGDSDDENLEETLSDDSDDHEANEAHVLSPEEEALFQARRAVEKLTEERKDLEYRIFLSTTQGLEHVSKGSPESLEQILHDIVDSGVLTSQTGNIELLSKYIEVLRDRYDSNPLWYELDVEALISSAVSDAINNFKDLSEITPEFIEVVRDMVVDDDAYSKLLEFQLLPPFANTPNFSIFQAVKNSAYPHHYDSIYSRFIDPFLVRSLTGSKKDCSWLVSDDWMELVPAGPALTTLLIESVKPRLTMSNSISEIVEWKKFFSSDEWRDIVRRVAVRISSNLKKLEPLSTPLEVIQAATEWSLVLSPCVVGFLLVDSGFLSKWFEGSRTKPDFPAICKLWLPILARVAYHSPAKKILLDCVRVVKGEPVGQRPRPGGPPPEFFARNRTQTANGPTEKVGLGDVIREEAYRRGLVVTPKGPLRIDGSQVFKVGVKSVYWKEDSIFLGGESGDWSEVAIDSLFN